MGFQKRTVTKPDGRRLHFYAFQRPLPELLPLSEGPQREAGTLELRWNPLLAEWVIVATERQERTFHPPAEYCPFCPTRPGAFATEVPAADYEIVALENRFPSFRPDAVQSGASGPPPYQRGRAAGVCEVVLYSPEHEGSLGFLPPSQARALVEVWADRYRELGSRDDVRYVFIFENRGPEIGVTLTHPHGQIYAFPYLPPRVEGELTAAAHHEGTGRCLQCDVVEGELREGERLLLQNEAWAAYVPFAARWPYEVHLASRSHRASLLDLSDRERTEFVAALQTVLQKYDHLWDFPMPYILVIHQAPTDGVARPGCHLHVELTPPYRSRDRLKYLAGCETGAGSFINDTLPEEKAQELRWAEPTT